LLFIIKGNAVSKQNLTRIVGIGWGIVLFLGGIVSIAQEISLEIDTPVNVTIGESPAWLNYDGMAGETITITTLTAITDTAPNTTLEILYPDGHRLDYVDDAILSDGSIKSDAIIDAIKLPIDGMYRIRVDSFNGVSEGEVEVILTQASPTHSEITTDNLTIISGNIPKLGNFQYTLEASADTTYSILVRDTSGTLDPVLRVYDNDGALIAFNDDHQSNDLSLDVLDARVIDLAISDEETLTITVSDYLGQSGVVELIISS
jgi:hypothetical protein